MTGWHHATDHCALQCELSKDSRDANELVQTMGKISSGNNKISGTAETLV